ncbi:MAG TPA: hypothetical protein VGK67_19455 [Myxococcales bacterium]
MPVSILFVFLVFGVGGSLGMALAQRTSVPTWALATIAVAGVAGYYVAAMGLPFSGPLSELAVVLLAALAMIGPAAWFFRNGKTLTEKQRAAKEEKRALPQRDLLLIAPVMVLALFAFATVLGTLTSRINYALWLRWSCDGTVVERTRDKGNHNLPLVMAKCGDQLERFEVVSDGFWDAAQPGQRLVKIAGSPYATLEGAKVRMVPLQVRWWNDPD